MEIKEEPYNYTYLVAFENMLKYGNKNYINIEDLIKYKNKYIQKIKDYKKVIESQKVDYEKNDDMDTISEFLDNYSELFYEEEGVIYINDDVTYSDIECEVLELTGSNEDNEEIYLAAPDSEDLLEMIGADYTNRIYEVLLKNELDMEKSYIEYLNNPSKENKEVLDEHMLNKKIILKAIEKLPDYKIEALRSIAIEKEAIMDDDYEYEDYPYNEELWSNIDHVDNLDIDEVLYSTKHYSIYSELPIYYKKLASEIETIYLSSIKDDFNFFEDLAEKNKETNYLDQLFYTKYIDNINKYLSKHNRDDDLLQSKERLIYALDNPSLCIYDDKNLNSNIAYINNIQIDKDELDLMKDEVMFLIGELFINESIFYNSQKLMLIKTYYDLTHDKDIIECFDGFKDCNNYNIYRETIFGKNKIKKL